MRAATAARWRLERAERLDDTPEGDRGGVTDMLPPCLPPHRSRCPPCVDRMDLNSGGCLPCLRRAVCVVCWMDTHAPLTANRQPHHLITITQQQQAHARAPATVSRPHPTGPTDQPTARQAGRQATHPSTRALLCPCPLSLSPSQRAVETISQHDGPAAPEIRGGGAEAALRGRAVAAADGLQARGTCVIRWVVLIGTGGDRAGVWMYLCTHINF